MDQRQLYDMHGYAYSGSGIQRHQGGDIFPEYRPDFLPERPENYETEPMVSSLAHTHNGYCTEGSGEVPNYDHGLRSNQVHNPYLVTSSETLDKDYASSGIILPLGIPDGYGPAGWTFQGKVQRRSQERGISDVMQSGGGPILHSGQRSSDCFSLHCFGANWDPTGTVEHMSASFNGALNSSYPLSSGTGANCLNHPHVDGNSVSQLHQRDFSSTMDWRLRGPKDYLLRPHGESVLSNRQLPTQETRYSASHDERLDVPSHEQSMSGLLFQTSAAVDAINNPVSVHAGDDIANKSPTKKRKRKPRTPKPRKPRTLTDEGKAHAKAVREYPGGACSHCKQKKTKARDPSMTDLVSTSL